MRLYTSTNWMLRSIQQGIQPLHVAADMAVKYRRAERSIASTKFWNWAANHKTVVCLNGGNLKQLEDDYAEIDTLANILKLPYHYFREDQESLAETLTSWGIVVPESIYSTFSDMRSPSMAYLDDMDISDLILKSPKTASKEELAKLKLGRMLAIKPLAT